MLRQHLCLLLFLIFVIALSIATFDVRKVKYRMNLYDVYHHQPSDKKLRPLQYDCLYYDVIDHLLSTRDNYSWSKQLITFCFRPDNGSSVVSPIHNSVNLPISDHKNYTFVQLKENSISSNQLFDWSAPIDLIEHYQAYLDGVLEISLEDSQILSTQEYRFYNCSSPWFGSRCQYFFAMSSVTLEDYIYDIYSGVFLWYPPNPSCYIHLTCDRGSLDLCLDWREICDGKDDCFNSEDEKDCLELEANQCDENEYRCHNGQCIPLNFYRDDELNPDCMDRTDEPLSMEYVSRCSTDLTFRCEEASCYPQISTIQSYSCGDGECIIPGDECRNMRHTSMKFPEPYFPWTNMESACFIAMSYLTGSGSESDVYSCMERYGKSCLSVMKSACSSHLFLFPATPIVLGHIYYVYNKTKIDRQQSLMTPMYVCFTEQYCTMKNVTQHRILNRTCVNYDKEFGKKFSIYPGWDDMNAFIEDYFQVACAFTKNKCLRSSLYQCDHSPKCISNDRLLDGIENCPLGDDEREVHACFLNETNKHRFRCPGTNFCLSPLAVNNGNYDCPYGEDETDPNQRYLERNIMFKFICDGIQDLFPIDVNGKNMTDETDCEQWPCHSSYTHCNSVWNCPKGEDELECDDVVIRCPPLHHPCISPNKTELTCLTIEKVRNGIIDCIGGSDERQMCREADPYLHDYRYYCWDDNHTQCFNRENIDLCHTETDYKLRYAISTVSNYSQKDITAIEKHLRNLEDKRDYQSFELRLSNIQSVKLEKNYHYNEIPVRHHSVITSRNTKSTTDSCFRGIEINVASQNGILIKCICPPAAYGEHCEYQNQRVSLTVQAQSASDWGSMFTFVFILMSDQNEIESYDHRYYSPSTDCAVKWNIYLLYRSRPKDPTKNYSIRVDVYKRETDKLEYRASWYYPIQFVFLPVYRLAIQITIPSRAFVNDETFCTRDCNGHGSCIIMNPNTSKKRALCRCNPGWIGDQCQRSQVPTRNCSCAPGSVCISSYPTSICVCPLDRGGPRCYIKLDSCQGSRECLNGGQCVPDDERRHSFFVKKCLCHKDFGGKHCELSLTKLTVTFHSTISIPSLTLVHLIKDKQLIKHQRVTTFKKILPYETSVVIHTTVTEFDLAFIEFNDYYYLSKFKKDNSNEILMHASPENRCQSIDKLFNSSFAQLHLIQRIKYYQIPCQKHPNLACFYDDVHMCICDLHRYAICILFEHNKTYICQDDSGNCENGGKCFQDDAQCPTTSACLCLDCFHGSKCQFSSKGSSFALDNIIAYQIRPERNLQKQLFVVKFTIILVSIMFITGMISGLLCALVFIREDARKVGCGLYLLTTSLLSIIIVIMLTLKVTFLLLAQMTYITNIIFLHIQCYTMDYILRTCLNVSDWLNACVAIERASSINQGVRFNAMKSTQIAKYIIFILFIIVAMSNSPEIIYRQLMTDDSEQRTWCVVRYPSFIQEYNTIIQIIHFFTPFICNIVSALTIIYKIARQRSLTQSRETLKQHIHKQILHLKHLILSPIILVLLATPRLIISLLSDCMKSDRDPWLLIAGYFISFAPSLLIYIVFILPSETYKNECKKLLINLYKKTLLKIFL